MILCLSLIFGILGHEYIDIDSHKVHINTFMLICVYIYIQNDSDLQNQTVILAAILNFSETTGNIMIQPSYLDSLTMKT